MAKHPSIEITPDLHTQLKKAAEKRGASIKSYTNGLLEQVGVADIGTKVILTIPNSLLKKDQDGLRKWLQVRTESIVKSFYH